MKIKKKRKSVLPFVFHQVFVSILSFSAPINEVLAFQKNNNIDIGSFYLASKCKNRRGDLALSSCLPFQRGKRVPKHRGGNNLAQELIEKTSILPTDNLPGKGKTASQNNDTTESALLERINVQQMINSYSRLSRIDSLRATIIRTPSLHQYIMDWDLPLRKFFSESNQTLPLSITYMDALRQQMEDFLNEISAAFSILQNDLAEEDVANVTMGDMDVRRTPLLDGSSPEVTYPYNIPYVTDFVAYLSKFLFASGYLPLLNSTVVNTPIESFFKGYDFTKIQPSDPIFSVKACKMARLAGDIYEDTLLQGTLNDLGHVIVVNGTSANVVWMITDSVDSLTSRTPMLARTVTVRGYSAVDARVDRIRLLQKVCSASPTSLGEEEYGIMAHSGLLDVAKEVYHDIRPYIVGLGDHHKLIFNGHSIGGSISILLLFLFTLEFGANFVRNNVKHVFTFGSPPVVRNTPNSKCDVLNTFGLPISIVKGYAQPWDPILRLFSYIDPLYPLIDDIGEDGKTMWVNGPPRTLRPLLKAIFETWEDWPAVRDISRANINQNYTHVGLSHLLLPESARYLTDQMVSMNIAAPPIKSIIQLHSSQDFLPMLNHSFPLDVFGISYVSTAVRSFLHHFHPSYSIPFVDFQDKVYAAQEETDAIKGANNILSFHWAKSAASWVLGGIGKRKSR